MANAMGLQTDQSTYVVTAFSLGQTLTVLDALHHRSGAAVLKPHAMLLAEPM